MGNRPERPLTKTTEVIEADSVDKFTPLDVESIHKSSLLIERKYLSTKGRAILRTGQYPLSRQIVGKVVCKSLLSINLALGFFLCVRRLRGLPMDYHPVELEPLEENA